MAELPQVVPDRRAQLDKVQLRRATAGLAHRQWGMVARWQLVARGLSSTTIARWAHEGRLIRIHPGVYAVGHAALSTEARLLAAILYAGKGSALSHATGSWWRGLLQREPQTIQVTTPHRRLALPTLRTHHRNPTRRTLHKGLPVVPVSQLLLDLAATESSRTLSAAIAQTDHLRLLRRAEIDAVCGRGRPGSTALSAALDRHLPQYARTRSDTEDRFLDLCRDHGIPMPEVNVKIAGYEVDAVWRAEGFAVELDGGQTHGTPAAMESDRRKDLALRNGGLRLHRYSWHQVASEPNDVARDVRDGLAASARRSSG